MLFYWARCTMLLKPDPFKARFAQTIELCALSTRCRAQAHVNGSPLLAVGCLPAVRTVASVAADSACGVFRSFSCCQRTCRGIRWRRAAVGADVIQAYACATCIGACSYARLLGCLKRNTRKHEVDRTMWWAVGGWMWAIGRMHARHTA